MKNVVDIELIKDLEDAEFAHSYLAEMANMRIASQVRAIRLQRNWTQEDVAQYSGVSQEKVSSIESGAFESLTLKTLRKLASAFDVHLAITFTDVGDALNDFASLSVEALQVPLRMDSLKWMEASSPSGYISIEPNTGTSRTTFAATIEDQGTAISSFLALS